MRHAYFGRKLSRTKNERRILFRGLARELIIYGKIQTTYARAKAVQPLVEKLVTKAKNGSPQKERELFAVISEKKVVETLLSDAKTRFADRSSGYTRIIKLGRRAGDATEMVLLSFVDEKPLAAVASGKNREKKAVPKKEEPRVEESRKKPVKRKKI